MQYHIENNRTYDILDFNIREMTECGRNIRTIGEGAQSMEEVAGRIVGYFYDTIIDGRTGERACSLVRFFKTHVYEQLDEELKSFAVKMLKKNKADPKMKCLTLLATIGEKPEWNSRKSSNGHQAIPLPSEEAVNEIPMIKNLIKQLGMSVSTVINPDPGILLDMEQKAFNIFFISEAVKSPYIPVQESFVVPFGIRSVLGFGGGLPSGDIFVTIIFFKVNVLREVSELFRTLSLNLKLAVLPFEKEVFACKVQDRVR
jgi:hypothetical protein